MSKRPADPAAAREAALELKQRERTGEAREYLDTFNKAILRVIGDASAWEEQARHPKPPKVLWPLVPAGSSSAAQLRLLFLHATVRVLFDFMASKGVLLPAPNEPDFQLYLRMAVLAEIAGHDDLCRRFGGTGSLSLKRELTKMLRQDRTAAAFATGSRDDGALQAAGISRAAAYRHLKRQK